MIRATLLALLATLPAKAQTFEEAVRANVWLATSLCTDAMIIGTPPATLFGAAGFVYRGIDRGVNSYGIAQGISHTVRVVFQEAYKDDSGVRFLTKAGVEAVHIEDLN